MELQVCAIYDKKTGLFDQPMTVRHNGDMIRQWDIVRKDQSTKYGKNPEDFSLFQIATYDDSLGELQPIKPHIHLADGV